MSCGNNKRCEQCQSLIFEDGTAEDCTGICDRELNIERDYVPLSFDEDGVLRDLPEPEPSWPDIDEGDDYER